MKEKKKKDPNTRITATFQSGPSLSFHGTGRLHHEYNQHVQYTYSSVISWNKNTNRRAASLASVKEGLPRCMIAVLYFDNVFKLVFNAMCSPF